MNAREAWAARRAAGVKTLEERVREDPARNARIEKHLAHMRLEQQMLDAMDRSKVTAAELARRVSRQPSAISRDLNGGLSRAKLGRIEELAEAIDHDFVVLVLPRNRAERRKALDRAARELA
jgi:hypothetical protein